MTEALLRSPRPADYEAIVSWIPDAEACTRWGGPKMGYPLDAAGLPGMLAMTGSQSFTLADGERPLGFGQYWVQTPGSVHLGRILVAPSARGRGLGTRLCRLLMARAVADTGASAITLRVYRDNAVARALYGRLGFGVVAAESDERLLLMRAAAASAAPGNGA